MVSLLDERLEEYARAHTADAPPVLRELELYTRAHRSDAGMLCGPVEGALLRLLVAITGARRVLEIGMYTGYSALSMAFGLPDDGELVACEQDPEVAAIAELFFGRTRVGRKIRIRMGDAAATLEALRDESFDLVFIDADKENYGLYYDRTLPLVRPGGLVVADNTLWSGRVLAPRTAADLGISAFNRRVREDPSVETVMLTVRDGVTVIRKRLTRR